MSKTFKTKKSLADNKTSTADAKAKVSPRCQICNGAFAFFFGVFAQCTTDFDRNGDSICIDCCITVKGISRHGKTPKQDIKTTRSS